MPTASPKQSHAGSAVASSLDHLSQPLGQLLAVDERTNELTTQVQQIVVPSVELVRGTYWHAGSGTQCAFSGSFMVTNNLLGDRALHLFGSIFHDRGEVGFFADLVDRSRGFLGREREAAVEWVERHCDGLLARGGLLDVAPERPAYPQ